MADIDVRAQAQNLAIQFDRYFEGNDDEFIDNATNDIMALISRLSGVPSAPVVEINKENGFFFLTEKQYDEAMRKGQEAFDRNMDTDNPYAFHRAFETAIKCLVSMRQQAESPADRLRRKLGAFFEEVRALDDPELSRVWMERVGRQSLSETYLRQDQEAQGKDRKDHSKPPLGLKPKRVALRERLDEVWGAIERYRDAGKMPPLEWFYEAGDLVQQIQGEI